MGKTGLADGEAEPMTAQEPPAAAGSPIHTTASDNAARPVRNALAGWALSSIPVGLSQ